MALSQYDQSVYDAGYKYIPQSQYLLNPFQVPTGSENEVPTGIATTYQAQNMMGGGGGGGFSPYSPDMSQIRTDFDPTAYNLAMRNEEKFGPTVGPNPDMYFTPQSKLQKAIGSAVNFIPGIGTLKRGAEFIGGFLKDKLPINQRAILENELRGSGVLTDNIGRIVARPGQYNTAEGIMAGYNAAQMNEGTFDKRTENIRETLRDKYDLSDTQINQLISGELDEDDFTGSKYQLPSGKVTNLFSNIRNIELAKQNFLRQKNKAAEIAAYKEKQRQQKALEKQRAASAKAAAELEAQRRGRRPGTGGGDGGSGGGGVRDSGGATGGYSYDSGGREGFGYGLADGGRVAYMMGGLTDLVDIYD